MFFSNELSDRNFKQFSRLVAENCGINLHAGKKELVRARLSKRLRATGCRDFNTYIQFLKGDADGKELLLLLDAISTNETSFFREPKHFEFLKTDVFPALKALSPKRLQFWSAGCSSGEEPYSLVMWLWEHFEGIDSWDLKILATDISTKVLAQAESGVYPDRRLSQMPKHQIRKYFQRGFGSREGYFRVKQSIKDKVVFRRQNLMEPFGSGPEFQLILCRNVMIYFDRETRQALIGNFYNCLKPGGYLMMGHAESLNGMNHRFRYIQPNVYQK